MEETTTMQRALVVAAGATAATAVDLLRDLLADDAWPAAAVALVAADDGAPPPEALEEAVARLGAYDLPRALARHGWALERQNEVLVHLLWEEGAPPPALAEQIVALLASGLGATAALILWQLCPAGAAAPPPALPNLLGTIRLSNLDQRGLRLPAPHGLATAAADLLLALLVTPLRDVVDWLGAQQGGLAPPTLTLGLRWLSWQPDADLTLLARRWARAALDAWREPVTGPSPGGWLRQAGLTPDALPVPPDPAPLHWRGQRPWLLGEAVDVLQSPPPAGGVLPPLQTLLHDPFRRRLTAVWHAALAQPAGGLARAGALLDAVETESEGIADRLGERHAVEDQAAREWAAAAAEAEAQVCGLLADWPPPRWWRPWRWPRAARLYWQLQRAGEQWAHTLHEARRWRVRADHTARLLTAYEALQRPLQQARGRLEELAALIAQWVEVLPLPATPGWLDDYYREQVADADAEVAVAAAAIGGLDNLADSLDERLLGPLLEAGRRRLAGVKRLTLTDVVARSCPEEPVLQQWWHAVWDSAAPLWRPALTPEPATLGVVVGRGTGRLAAGLDDVDDTPVRWIDSGDPRHIFVLRARILDQ